MQFVRTHVMEIEIEQRNVCKVSSVGNVMLEIILHSQDRVDAFEVYQDRQERAGYHQLRYGTNTQYLV